VIVTEPSRSPADLIVECLENEGVTHVFGIPGEENIRLVEAISRSSILWVPEIVSPSPDLGFLHLD
jgi:acetolactate synthase-1/2/3 large subunit